MPIFVSLEEKFLAIEHKLQDWAVPGNGDLTEPTSKVLILQRTSLRSGSCDFRRTEQLSNVQVNTGQERLNKALPVFTEIVQKGKVQGVKVWLRTDSLDDEVMSKPIKVFRLKQVLEFLRFLLDAIHRKVVDQELHFVKLKAWRCLMLNVFFDLLGDSSFQIGAKLRDSRILFFVHSMIRYLCTPELCG